MNMRMDAVPQSIPEETLNALLSMSLTDTQRLYLSLYCHGVPMRRIAEMYDVNPSTVSRTISRASSRLKRAGDTFRLIRGSGRPQ